jgi:nucleoside-diphosphate-sugar epimerase
MRILITGADGFIGRALVQRLTSSTAPGLGAGAHQLALVDRAFARPPAEPSSRAIAGDLADAKVLREALGDGVDLVFHLASVPGGAAEADFELGQRANLAATMNLLDLLRTQRQTPRFVFASTIGVYGVPMPELIDEHTIPAPSLSYGAQKLMGEILVSDASRRAFIDGRSLRLPGIVARPAGSGMLSGFLSELIRSVSAGKAFTCPVSADGMSWWMSRSCVVDNLLHAAALGPQQAAQRRVWLLPVLHASIRDIVGALARVHGESRLGKVTYAPNQALQAQFASYPPLHCPASVAAGFKHDGSLEALVQRALDGP